MSSAGFTNGAAAPAAQTIDSVQTLIRSGNLAEATKLAISALDAGAPLHPLLLHLRALALEGQGRIAEALQDLRQGVDIAPRDPIAHFAYGELLTRIGDTQNASLAFRRTLALRPDYGPAWRQLGLVNCQSGEVEAGRQCYERAVSLDPGDADALAGLAEIAQRAGDDETAKGFADRALAKVPGHPVASLVQAAILIGSKGSAHRAERAIRKLLDDPARPAQDRAIAVSLLGDLRHAQKRYDEAFDAYAQANREKRIIFAPRFERPGQENAYTYASWLGEYGNTAPVAAWRARRGAVRNLRDDGPRGHVFIVGFPRSGTTLLENVLVGSPEVAALQEQSLLHESVRDLLSSEEGRARLSALNEDDAEGYREHYWRRVAERGLNLHGKVFIDNNPLNTMKLLLVARLFPDAKILFAVRDPRDVVLSCFRSSFAMSPAMYEFLDLERAARFYDAVMRLGRSCREDLGLEWRDHRHEALVRNFESELAELCDFLSVEKVPAMSDFAELAKKRKIATRSAAQVRRGLSQDGIGTWRSYEKRLAPVLPVLRPWVETFGYES
jgi:tetratricopeptide (TPR) repeat protein